MSSFKITHRDKRSRARVGILRTPHGTIHTPAYIIVATRAQVKMLQPRDLKRAKIQAVIANAYHLWEEVQNEKIKNQNDNVKSKTSFLQKRLGIRIPTMTDSGGFQVFSYGAAREHGVGKVLKRGFKQQAPGTKRDQVRITEKGAVIIENGKRTLLTPEDSIRVQEQLGADIIFAFDECTSPLHNFAHTRTAMERTHRWLTRSIKAQTRTDQMLYGILQGGRFASLRKQSALFVATSAVDGIGIGGSFGKDEMVKTLQSVISLLPDEKPRHLLGIGRIDDVFHAVASGIDTFDCVIPTREARHGRLWTDAGPYDIRLRRYARSTRRLAPRCQCPPCASGIRQKDLYALMRAKSAQGARYATLHNVWFFNHLLSRIRTSIARGTFSALRKRFQNTR